jgi:hypothetical protein
VPATGAAEPNRQQCFKIGTEFIVFLKIRKNSENQKNSTETKLTRARNMKIFETRNSVGLTELSTIFKKKPVVFENRFDPLRIFE